MMTTLQQTPQMRDDEPEEFLSLSMDNEEEVHDTSHIMRESGQLLDLKATAGATLGAMAREARRRHPFFDSSRFLAHYVSILSFTSYFPTTIMLII